MESQKKWHVIRKPCPQDEKDSSDDLMKSSEAHAISSDTHAISSEARAISSDRPIISSEAHAISSDTHAISSDLRLISIDRPAISIDNLFKFLSLLSSIFCLRRKSSSLSLCPNKKELQHVLKFFLKLVIY